MGKSAEKKGRRMTKRMLTAAMADMFQEYNDEDITLNKVYQELRLKTHPLKMLAADIIKEMLEEGYIEEGRRGYYHLSAAYGQDEAEAAEESIIGKQFVGTLKVDRNYAYLITNSRELAGDIFIPKERLKGGKSGGIGGGLYPGDGIQPGFLGLFLGFPGTAAAGAKQGDGPEYHQ